MLKKYIQYIKESSSYRYPYSRIMILINSIDDYYKVLNFVEDNFNIEINLIRDDEYFRNPYINLNHILLSVPLLYLIIRKERHKIDDVDILRFYSTEISNINELLEIINDNVGSYYFNEKDILSIDDLNVVISLLKTGKKDTYNYLYNKEKINVYESLLDKLKGPNEEEILKAIKEKTGKILEQAVINGNIEIVKKIFETVDNISKDDKNYAMWYACQYNKYDIVKLLNDYGVNINMEVASNKGYVDILQLGLDRGQIFIKTNILKGSVNGGNLSSFKFIFDKCDINKTDVLPVILHVIRLTGGLNDNGSELFLRRVEMINIILNSFSFNIEELNKFVESANENNSFTIKEHIKEYIKKYIDKLTK